jgi:hypothetical protein
VKGVWGGAAEHFITDGVPFGALPETMALPYRADGEVLATVGEHPLLVIGELGRGRVAAASWVVAGLRRREYDQTYGGVGLLPNMFALGSTFAWDAHYWEYQMSLLMRMIYWAARKDHSFRGHVAIGALRPDGTGEGVLTLRDTAGRESRVAVTWTLRDRYSRVIDAGVTEESVQGDRGCRIPIAFRNAALGGTVYLETIVDSGDGKAVVWWGTAAGRVDSPSEID